MINLGNLTTSKLKTIINIKEQIEALQSQIDSITAGGGEIPIPPTGDAPKKRRRSPAVRARMAAAAKARWAKIKGTGATDSKPAKRKDWRSSPATRAKLSAAAKARWKKARAEGKTRL